VASAPSRRIGVTPTGLLSVLLAAILLTMLFRISSEVSLLRAAVTKLAQRGSDDETKAAHGQAVVIVPAFNEEQSVASVVASIRNLGFDCIVVDDGSRDATHVEARRAGAVVVRHAINLGVGAALRTGLRKAVADGCDLVVQCDADGQHHADEIPAMIELARSQQTDLLVGSRWVRSGSYGGDVSLVRRAAMKVLARLASSATGVPITDPTSGFRVFSRRFAAVASDHLGDHYLSDTFELLVRAGRAGYRAGEAPVKMSGRATGEPSVRGLRLLLLTGRTVLVSMLRLTPPLPGPKER
jgi:glycosyltransferase involved in cell wall biosynthesis